MDNAQLTAMVQRIGQEFNYKDASATFEEFRDFKVRWKRSYQWIELEVSDYLQQAPESVVEHLLRCIFSKIRGDDADYPDDVVDYIDSDEFRAANRITYLQRCRCIMDDGRLQASYDRLVEKGLLERDDRLVFGYISTTGATAGSSSNLLKTVFIREKVAEDPELLDLVVYYHSTHASLPYREAADKTNLKVKCALALSQYPDHEELQDRLIDMGLRL